jgi:hypothetical protein
MKKDFEAKPDLPYICAVNRALIYICAFPLPPQIINVDLRKEEGGLFYGMPNNLLCLFKPNSIFSSLNNKSVDLL